MDKITRRILDTLEEINAVPRCSKNEERIRDWLIDWAKHRSLAWRQDAAGNLCIVVPATAGMDSGSPVVIQGHMDMVCEKTPQSTHDFSTDPIRMIYDGEWVGADGTTLGADNGIALALALVLADSSDVVHPPLELLLTVDEESGLIGAKALDPALIEGTILLNIDSEQEGVFTVGCAGGQDIRLRLELERSPSKPGHPMVALTVKGLCGGHSGIDIHKPRASANKLLARCLLAISKEADIRLSTMQGGTVHNAIARDARALLSCRPDALERVRTVAAACETDFRREYGRNEPSLAVTVEPVDGPAAETVVTGSGSRKVVDLLMALPHGVAGMSSDIDGLVETSNNLAVVELGEQGLSVLSSQRSGVMSRLAEISARIEAVAALAGATAIRENGYPAWEPNLASPLLERCRSVYRATFGREPVVQSIHAGLECGLIGAKKAGMDMISFGPTIRDPHSPGERLHVPSIRPVWDFLTRLLTADAG